jgi:endonuclease/exonuclease/phosphatase (EEP) superfamily protein YafD
METGSCHCVVVRVAPPRGPVTLLAAHPWPPGIGVTGLDTSEVAHTIDVIMRTASKTHASLIVGDFNTSDRNYLYRRLRSRYGDSFRDAGAGPGFTYVRKRLPLIRIDYVFHSHGWATVSAKTGVMPGSDHRYLSATLVR